MRLPAVPLAGSIRLAIFTTVIAMGAALTGCNGSSGNPLSPITGFGPGSNAAQVRFVNGSPDAGPVQVFIDNQQQYCSNGASGTACSVSYGAVTSYAVTLSPGQHAVVLRDQNGNAITLPSGALSVNAGFRYSVVLTGELHPSYGGGAANLGLTTFSDEPFSASPAVNFHNASAYLAATGSGPLAFGYFTNNSTASATVLGQPVAFGSESTPQTIPSTAQNVPITFYAGSASGTTVTPGQISPSACGSNSLPCSTGNLSLYLIDGPAASTSPTTVPTGFSSSATSVFVGAFD